ncbi:MAG TPA: cyclopropane-fatty-acyl-phospholipid synthase family protein [Thermoleophilaceae bacterium]|nr:cyclopropane-fatty-acyl-phospholipid synthase family protein [Thermoleophilaceae bacterium]
MIARSAGAAVLGLLREGRIDVVEAGTRRSFGPAAAEVSATVTVNSPRFWSSLIRGSAPLARSYADGDWDSRELVDLVRIGAREMPRLDRLRRPFLPLRNALTRIPLNTRAGAREHVAAHYDLGDELFRLFLDETMTYSCAVFDGPHTTLAEAQERKLDLVCRKLGLGPGDHVLEIGTGWGSFAVHAASRYGCRVTTTTISAEQHAAASERVREAGLSDRVEVLAEDYRDLRGRYDKLVSIEMIEAVGWQYFDDFFRRCSALLRPHGSMLLQAIVIDDDAYEAEKTSRTFIRELIFPSGCLPSVVVIEDCVRRTTDMRVLALDDITEHYPETLRRWREGLVAAADTAEALGYDRRFRRLWELYLAYSEGGFRERRIRDVQLTLAKPAHVPSRVTARLEPASPIAAGVR